MKTMLLRPLAAKNRKTQPTGDHRLAICAADHRGFHICLCLSQA